MLPSNKADCFASAGDNKLTLCACKNDGTVLLMQLSLSLLTQDVRQSVNMHSSHGESAPIAVATESAISVLKAVRLPSECFSSPVVFREPVYVGCRDDYLYCLV